MTLVSKQEKLFEDIDINNYDKEPYVLLDNSESELAKMNRFGKEVTVFEASIQIIYDLLKSREINQIYCILWNNETIKPFDDELVDIDKLFEISIQPNKNTILYQALQNIPNNWLNRKTNKDLYIVTDGQIQDIEINITKELKKLYGYSINIYIITVEPNNYDYLIDEISSGDKLYSIIRNSNMMYHLKEFISFNERTNPFISFSNPTLKPNQTVFRNKVFRIDRTYEFITYISNFIKNLNNYESEILKLSHELSITIYYLIKDKPTISRNQIIDLFCKIFQNTKEYYTIRQSIYNEIKYHEEGKSTTFHTYVLDRKNKFKNAQLSLYENVKLNISSLENQKFISFTLDGLIILVNNNQIDQDINLHNNVYKNGGFLFGKFIIPVLSFDFNNSWSNDTKQAIRVWIRNNLSLIYNTNPVSDYTIWKFILTYILKILLNDSIHEEIKLCFKKYVLIIFERLRYETDITEYNFLLKNPPTTNLGNEEKFNNILINCMKNLNIKLSPLTFWYGFIKIFNDKNLIEAQKSFCVKSMKVDKIDETSIIEYLKLNISSKFTIIDLTQKSNYNYQCYISNTDTSLTGGYIYPSHELSDTIQCSPNNVISYESYEELKDFNHTCPICYKIINSNEMIKVPPINKFHEELNINELYNMHKYEKLDIETIDIDLNIISMDEYNFDRGAYSINQPYLKDPLVTSFMIIKKQQDFNEYVKEKYPFLDVDLTGAYILGGFCRSVILNQKVRDIDIIFYGENYYKNLTRILQQLIQKIKLTITKNIKLLIMYKKQFNVFELIIIENPNNVNINTNFSYEINGIKILHRIQFIMIKNKSLKEIFENVDFYPCMIVWDGFKTLMTKITAFSYKYMINIIDEYKFNDLFDYRFSKYFKYGFIPVLPYLDIDKIENILNINGIEFNIIKKMDNCLYGNINNKSYELEVEELKNLSKKELYLDCKINSLKTIFKFINCNNILFKICDDISLKEENESLFINDIEIKFIDKIKETKYYKDLYELYRKNK